MTLSVGEQAPGFALPNKPGGLVDVGEMIGDEKVVILFFPFAFSSVCTEAVKTAVGAA
jgi:peroxiredoxin